MGQTLSSIQFRLSWFAAASITLTPIVAIAVEILYGLVNPDLLLVSPLVYLLLAANVLLLAGSAWYFLRFTKPLLNWHHQNDQGLSLPDALSDHLQGFTTRYWSFMLISDVAFPLLLFTQQGAAPAHYAELLHVMLLYLVVGIYVGMPGYLACLSVLGKLTHYIGLTRVQVSIRSKLLLIGAYLPILTSAVFLHFYAWRTGGVTAEVMLAWAGIALVAIAITAVAIYGLRQALAPVSKVISGSGASSYQHLEHRLRPQSLDEIGYMTQLLGQQFKRRLEQDSHVAAIVDNSAEGIIVLDDEQQVSIVNPAAEALFGYRGDEISGKPLRWLLPELDLKFEKDGPQPDEIEVYGRHRNGSSVPMSVRCSRMQFDGRTFYTLLVADISERKAAERRLLEAESRYRNLVETAHDLVWSMDKSGRWTYLNNAVKDIYGLTADSMLGRHYAEFQAPESRERDAEAVTQLASGKELFQYETIHLDANGERHYLSFNARPMLDNKGEVVQVSGTARDITAQKRFEQELTYQAQHDKLTGLYNRNYFQSELERLISRIARSAAECALLYLDLDQFKYVNDTLGHAAGDRLLKECTEMLRKNVREGDLLARFGGDEFTILLYNIDHSHALPVAQNIRTMFEHYRFMDSGKTFNVTCSIGLTMIDNETQSADEALARADLACNISKSHGRNCVHEYNDSDNKENPMAEDMGWAERVRDAVDNDRFKILYQPIVAMQTQEVYGYEVLLRLPTDDGQIIKPGGFIPAAERLGLMPHIDHWIVEHSMRYLADLQDNDVLTRFCINLSGRVLGDEEMYGLIQGLLQETGLNPASLSFEITEDVAIANLQAARRFIQQIRDLGCRVTLDNFGSGFCSFTYLKHLPVDALKIDGRFIQGLTQSRVDQAMVRSMNEIAHALGKSTIAEYVENRDTLRLLETYAVDYAQGHFLGKPRSSLLHGLHGSVRDAPLTA